MWEEMKQLNVEYKHTLRDVKHPIVPASLVVSSCPRASHIVVLAWRCLNMKASDFLCCVLKKDVEINLSYFCRNSYSVYPRASTLSVKYDIVAAFPDFYADFLLSCSTLSLSLV